jgi:hypothetical protein
VFILKNLTLCDIFEIIKSSHAVDKSNTYTGLVVEKPEPETFTRSGGENPAHLSLVPLRSRTAERGSGSFFLHDP